MRLRVFFFSSRRRHTRYISVTGVQTCALPIYENLAGFQPSYNLWSARIDYNTPDGRWNLAFWGKNLGNEQYLSTAQSFRTPRSLAGTGIQNGFATVGYMGLPRSYGVTLTVNFGS